MGCELIFMASHARHPGFATQIQITHPLLCIPARQSFAWPLVATSAYFPHESGGHLVYPSAEMRHRACNAAGAAPAAVAVPTHFFKVVLAEHKTQSGATKLSVGAFAMPNRPIPPNTPLASFCVPLDLLETLTGIEFFPGALTAKQRSAVDLSATGRPPRFLLVQRDSRCHRVRLGSNHGSAAAKGQLPAVESGKLCVADDPAQAPRHSVLHSGAYVPVKHKSQLPLCTWLWLLSSMTLLSVHRHIDAGSAHSPVG